MQGQGAGNQSRSAAAGAVALGRGAGGGNHFGMGCQAKIVVAGELKDLFALPGYFGLGTGIDGAQFPQ